MACEVVEQAKLGGGGGHEIAAHGESHGRGIDLYLADFQGAGRKRALKTAQHGLDAGDEFARAEGLGDVVVGAQFEAEDAIGFAAFRCQKNYRDRRQAGSLANGATYFQAVFARYHNVENEECGTLALSVGQYVGSGGINANGEAFVFEMMADQAGNVGIVFDDEKTWFHGIIVAKAVAST